jgi:hypothetical protein
LAQRARLLSATAVAHLEGKANVTRVTVLSGVGRTTFYECFDDFAHALAQVRDEVARRMRRALGAWAREASGGHDKTRALCRAWLGVIAEEPVTALVALAPASSEVDSQLMGPIRQALTQLSPAVATRGEMVLVHATACAMASARAVALACLGAQPGTAPSLSRETSRAPESMVQSLAAAIRRLLADNA